MSRPHRLTRLRVVLVWRVVLILLTAFLATTSTTQAQLGINQKRISQRQWRRGFHGFNMIAEGNNLTRISVNEFHLTPSQDVLLIAIGSLRNLPVNVTNHVNDGGAALIASDGSGPFQSARFAGFEFGKIRYFPTRDTDAFEGMQDCPIVSDFRAHPTTSGINEIVTNRPGFVIANDRSTLASLPGSLSNVAFAAARKNRRGGRAVAVGDQSIFTNQMIIYGDNLQFANQTVKWLKQESRKVLFLVDGSEYSVLDPADVIVDVPPPSQKEVMDAIQDIPSSAMLEFANSVATVVEDENMVNEFLHDSVENVPESMLNRFYIYLMFGVACLGFVAAFLFQRKLQSQTGSDVALRRSQGQQVDLKAVQFHERQQAAHFLLEKFCIDMAQTRFADWPNFPAGLIDASDRESKVVFESMTKMSVLYRSKPTGFWSRKKLASLEKEVGQWRGYFLRRPAREKQAVT